MPASILQVTGGVWTAVRVLGIIMLHEFDNTCVGVMARVLAVLLSPVILALSLFWV